MAYSTTYPPGQVSLIGQNELKENRFPHVTYVGRDGTKFYLSGPLAPIVGAQNGVASLSMSGLAPPFQHLDNQGARQDGTTWFDALYDAAEIDMQVEVSGVTTADTRAVVRSWFGAWDAKQRGRLHAFTPENGEWWARVRQLQSPKDQVQHTYENYGKQRWTWAARNDDAFWESFDSVAQFSANLTTTIGETFPTVGTGIAGWTQTYSGTGAGTCDVTAPGLCSWTPSGNGTRAVINRAPIDSATDNQVATIKFNAPQLLDFELDTFNDIWCRLDNAGNGIRARIGDAFIILSRFVAGVETVLWQLPTIIAPLWNEEFSLICGTSLGARNFKVQRGGFTIIDFTENGTQSLMGAAHRGWGWGMQAGPGILGSQVSPAPISGFRAGDNNTISQNGFLPLINRGDQDGWPRYLCYGPGTFTFSDGPAPANFHISFGPLLEGQIALVTTLPRLRGVTDLSPNAPAAQTLDQFQQIVKALISFATNNNVPPLLQQFESQFGILPPQGNMYSLLTGRFTTPLPPKVEALPPKAEQIACGIVGGNAATKIVAALTPLRRWPL